MWQFRLLGLLLASQHPQAAQDHGGAESNHPQPQGPDAPRIAAGRPPTTPQVGRPAADGHAVLPAVEVQPGGRAGLELKGLVELVGSVAAPVTVVTSVLFYFGLVYTGAFYGYFAISRNVLDLSVRDYLIRSINPMLWPLIVVVALAALWTWAHGLVVRVLMNDRRRPLLRRLSLVVGGLGVVCFITGVIAPRVGNPYSSLERELIAPLSFAAGAALVGYAGHVHQRSRSLSEIPAASRGVEPRWLRPARLGLLAVLVTISLLWAVSYYADALGRGDGYQLAVKHFDHQPAVIVNSTRRLFLDPFGGVQETRLVGKDAAFPFRYTNLRLLIRSGGKYFLVPSGWSTADPVVIVLRDDDTVSIQFVRT